MENEIELTKAGDALPLCDDVFGRVRRLGRETVTTRTLPPGLDSPTTGNLK